MIDYREPKDLVAQQDPNRDSALCPLCEEPVTTEIVDFEFRHGDLNLKVTLPVRQCDDCEIESMDHVGARIKDEAVYHAHGRLSPWDIRAIRERRGLSRPAFARITGIGEASIKRWETGAIAQNRANDRYLRLLATAFGWARLKKEVRDLESSIRDKETRRQPTARDSGSRFPHMGIIPSNASGASRFSLAA